MNTFASYKRRSGAALAATVAALTLYSFNIYPSDALASEGDWLTIDQVFDFQVPEEVISSGVSNALVEYSNEWATIVEAYTNEALGDLLSSAVTNTNFWATRDWYGDTNVFYHVRTNEQFSLLSGTFGIAGLSRAAVDLAFDGSNAVSHLGQGASIPWLDVPDWADYDLSSEELPEGNPFETANPLISGLSPPAGWFLDRLPAGALYDAVFLPWQSEIAHLTSYTFNGVQPFGYFDDLLHNSCRNLEIIISDARVSPRKIFALLFSLANLLLIFKWWLWRIFRIWAQ